MFGSVLFRMGRMNVVVKDGVLVFLSGRRRHTRYWRDWSSDVCSSDLGRVPGAASPAQQCRRTHCQTRRAQPTPGRLLQIGRASCRKESRSGSVRARSIRKMMNAQNALTSKLGHMYDYTRVNTTGKTRN